MKILAAIRCASPSAGSATMLLLARDDCQLPSYWLPIPAPPLTTRPTTSSRPVGMAKLERPGPLGPVLIRLMMAINDLTFASDALGIWNREVSVTRRRTKAAARGYFLRLQVAHLYSTSIASRHVRQWA